jgi:RNA methyltransferase, TrmH family
MISSPSNAKVKWVRALQGRRKAREEEAAFVVEGTRWAEEVVAAEARARLVLHTDHLDDRGRGLVNRLARQGAEIVPVSDEVMAACSDTETPQGLLLVLDKPNLPAAAGPNLALIADRVADPGNLGTMMRTALAAGVELMVVTPGTVDAFNPKVVRSAMGAHLHLPLRSLGSEPLAQLIGEAAVWLAEAGAGVPYDQVDWRKPVALVIGGEAHGASPQTARQSPNVTHIPMNTAAESLNAAVAAAVILFEIRRQRGSP